MAHPFKVGDQVIFYRDNMTTKTFNSNAQMKRFLAEGTVLTVVELDTSMGGHPIIGCSKPDGIIWNYHPADLKLAEDNRTEDEKYLDNLIKGAK